MGLKKTKKQKLKKRKEFGLKTKKSLVAIDTKCQAP